MCLVSVIWLPTHLRRCYQVSFEAALTHVQQCRGVAQPNPGFCRQLREYEQKHLSSPVDEHKIEPLGTAELNSNQDVEEQQPLGCQAKEPPPSMLQQSLDSATDFAFTDPGADSD